MVHASSIWTSTTCRSTREKLAVWINYGFNRFQRYLLEKNLSAHVALPQPQFASLPWEQLGPGYKLLLQPSHNTQSSCFCLGSEGGTVGRMPMVAVTLHNKCISRMHAEFISRDGKFFVQDLESTCGTFVLLQRKTKLALHSRVDMGAARYQVVEIGEGVLKLVDEFSSQNVLTVTMREGDRPVGIGRNPNNKLASEDQLLSRFHAKLYHTEDAFFLEDMSSTNGTWLQINGPVELLSGTILRFGTDMVFECAIRNCEEIMLHRRVSQDLKCLICMQRARDALIEPCSHNSCCLSCANTLNACPICRMPITDLQKIFWA